MKIKHFIAYGRYREIVKLFRFLLSPYRLTGTRNNVQNYTFSDRQRWGFSQTCGLLPRVPASQKALVLRRVWADRGGYVRAPPPPTPLRPTQSHHIVREQTCTQECSWTTWRKDSTPKSERNRRGMFWRNLDSHFWEVTLTPSHPQKEYRPLYLPQTLSAHWQASQRSTTPALLPYRPLAQRRTMWPVYL
jgi:hypothetical protein